jgi:hypothetical protein
MEIGKPLREVQSEPLAPPIPVTQPEPRVEPEPEPVKVTPERREVEVG